MFNIFLLDVSSSYQYKATSHYYASKWARKGTTRIIELFVSN